MELEDKKVAVHSSMQATKKVNLEELERIKTLAMKETKKHQDQVAERKMSRTMKEKETRQNQAFKNLECQRQNAMIRMPGMNNFQFQAQNPMMNMMSGMMNMMGMVSAMGGGSSASDPFVNMHNGFKQKFNQPSIESPTKNDNTYVRDSLIIESVGE